jgi:hypothetical protein
MVEKVDEMFREQSKTWRLLAKGLDGLTHAQARLLHVDWFDVHLRHIPHRVKSTTAAVDRESIMKRPCFLCAENLDPEQKGIPFGSDFSIYCNPFPIVQRHLTILHHAHRPQLIAGQAGTMLDLARALPGYFVIYNGPECGASAPDHLHFQAGSRELFPIEKETAKFAGPAVTGYARNVVLFRGVDRAGLEQRMEKAMELLGSVTGRKPEPLINIAAFHDARGWTIYLFPRGKHRPDVFHTGELTVSPATIDLCGIFVVPIEKDFARIAGSDVDGIFKEVTLRDDLFNEVIGRL